MKRVAVALVAMLGCTPAPWAQRYGYYLDVYPAYPFKATVVTPSGIAIDMSGKNIPGLPAAVEASVLEVQSCLGKSIDRSAFRVKVPPDWMKSCDGSQEVLPFATPDRFCKGEAATNGCPCRYRALLQEPNIVVVTPNLLLFKDALVRLLTGTADTWSTPSLAKCLAPHVP
jgi:hypothetical protein